ncbi:hypothetical protein P8452_73123 [Trifolium repens]|nr:hypothetical protein P8452_73123 [Trifolium repens]
MPNPNQVLPSKGEEEVWSMVEDRDCDRDMNFSPGEWDSRAISRRRNRDQDHRNIGGLSQAFENPGSNVATTSSRIVHNQYRASHRVVATSAPVNVPDWSKILRVDSVESLHDMDDGYDDNDSEMVPPHEYLARGRKMAAKSVFEGVGRTLKGRDLRRVPLQIEGFELSLFGSIHEEPNNHEARNIV